MSSQVLILSAEANPERVGRNTRGTLAMAREAAALLGTSFDILVPGGRGAEQSATRLSHYGARHVLVGPSDAEPIVPESIIGGLADLCRAYRLVLAPGCQRGKDLLPRLAAKLDAAYIADCLRVAGGQGGLRFTRTIFAGSILTEVESTTAIQLVTVSPGAGQLAVPVATASPVQSVPLAASLAATRIRVARHTPPVPKADLGGAKVIVAGGRALKTRFSEVLEPLAQILGGALGASRAAVEAGFAPADWQVGQTGSIVAPQLYVAVGISGAVQHQAGMKASRTIVAINKDPKAPIFDIADYGLVADLFEAVPELVSRLSGAPVAPRPSRPRSAPRECPFAAAGQGMPSWARQK